MAAEEAQVHSLEAAPAEVSPVYGPVRSWRFGASLGIDPIGAVSTCSFNCVYCQLGEIQRVTSERMVYVPTERLERALGGVDWAAVDVATFSGSGEPTLALNLAEMIAAVKRAAPKPVHILTNATLFGRAEVRAAVRQADVVACKLDAATEKIFQRMNRPAPGITLDSVLEGILKLKAEFPGKLELQIMFMPMNAGELEGLAALAKRIAPAEIHLNTPQRPYPLEWHVETRGDHGGGPRDWPSRRLAVVSREEAREIEGYLRRETGVPLISVYREA